MATLAHSYFVIQHKETEEVMPEVHTGYTHWHPGKKEDNRDSDIPRLFSTHKKAVAALRSYCLGEHTVRHTGDVFDGYFVRERVNPRNISDFQIVELALIPFAAQEIK